MSTRIRRPVASRGLTRSTVPGWRGARLFAQPRGRWRTSGLGRSTVVALLALLSTGLLLVLGGTAIILLIMGDGRDAMSSVLPLFMVLLAAAALPESGRAGTRR